MGNIGIFRHSSFTLNYQGQQGETAVVCGAASLLTVTENFKRTGKISLEEFSLGNLVLSLSCIRKCHFAFVWHASIFSGTTRISDNSTGFHLALSCSLEMSFGLIH